RLRAPGRHPSRYRSPRRQARPPALRSEPVRLHRHRLARLSPVPAPRKPGVTPMKPEAQFIVHRHGQELVRYAGLLDLAHRHETWKLRSIVLRVEKLPSAGGTTPAVVSAEITFADEKSFPRAFHAIAEAVPDQIPSLRA